MVKSWHDLEPLDYVQLPYPGVEGPLNEQGMECPWPWEPQELAGSVKSPYPCSYCGAMVVPGVPHVDYRRSEATTWELNDLEGGRYD